MQNLRARIDDSALQSVEYGQGSDRVFESPAIVRSSTQYLLPDHVYACWPGTGAVLLDLKRNRYFGLDEDDAHALRQLLGMETMKISAFASKETVRPEALAGFTSELTAAGLLVEHRADYSRIATTSVDLERQLTSIGYEKHRSARIRPDHVLNHLRSCLWVKWALATRTFYGVVSDMSQRKQTGASLANRPDIDVMTDLVCIFQRLRGLTFTSSDQCLFHALALVRFLSEYAIFPTWVIGVTTSPWGTHSWVQHDRLILDATPEQVCEYTPILAI